MSYSALLGIVCADEDDDGEQAVSHYRNSEKAVPVEEKVTTEHLEQLCHELQDEHICKLQKKSN